MTLRGFICKLTGSNEITSVFTARRCASAVYAVGVCLSVCPYVTSRYRTKKSEHRITQTARYDRPGTLVFNTKNLNEIPTGSPPTEAPNRDGVG